MIDLTLPAGSTPTIQPYDPDTGLAVGSPISGAVVGSRTTLFRFDTSALDEGDYVMDLASPAGRFVYRKTETGEFIADEFWELDLATSSGSESGTGARLVSITVLLGGVEQQSARVRLTKGAETYLATTNSSGVAAFNVDDGSWAVSITLAGATFAGATLVVDGNETVSYSLTANSAIAASDPGKITGYWLCLSQAGTPESGVTVTLTAMSLPANSTGLILDSASRSVTTEADGVASFTNLIPGVRYKVKRNSGREFYFVCPDYQSDPVDLASFIGT